jgi:hypothetical protein
MNPGIYDDLDETAYHADEALSASGAKKLLPPSCPAKFRWERDHGQEHKREFDLGRAVHSRVLGIGGEIEVVHKVTRDKQRVPAEDYATKSAQEHRDEIRATGKTPLLAHELAQVEAMTASVRANRTAAALFDPDRGGRPEVSAFWHDDEFGADRRCRFDWLPPSDGGRLIVPDLKTAMSSEPKTFSKSAFNFGYPVQAVFYEDGARAHQLAEEFAFIFVAVEKTPPYVVTLFQLDSDSLRIGRAKVDQALSVFAECTATGEWPGYSSDIELISPPAWALYEMDAA